MKKRLQIKAGFKPAFTMIELVFVIVVLGILATVAIPRLAATRDDAVLVKGKSQVAAIRSGLAMQKAKNLLEGNNQAPLYTPTYRLAKLDDVNASGHNKVDKPLFYFGDGNTSNILGSPILSKKDSTGGWMKIGVNIYTFEHLSDKVVTFTYNSANGTFNCTPVNALACKALTQ